MSENRALPCPDYRSKLAHWDQVAAVRSKPRRVLQEEIAQGAVAFPLSLLPLTRITSVRHLGPCIEKSLAAQALYRYLDFTERLELDAVNVVAQSIARREVGFPVPSELAFDAYKVYCDEAYHAYFSIDLQRQIVGITRIEPLTYDLPIFLRVLRRTEESVSAELRPLVQMIFVVIAETLISASLAQIPGDKTIPAAVRELVADHLEDEGRHHALFSSFFELLWPALSARQKNAMIPLMPTLIRGFLEPDRDALRRELAAYNMAPTAIECALEEAYPPDSVQQNIYEAAAATMRLFEHNGVLEETSSRDFFSKAGLLPRADQTG
jgi:hypothetical protein